MKILVLNAGSSSLKFGVFDIASMRRRICDGLAFMGVQLDFDRNDAPDLSDHAAPQIRARDDDPTRLGQAL